MVIRREIENDYEEVENLTREAFWDLHKPGCDEHLVAHQLRKASAFIPGLDLVAVQDGRIVGNIMYTRAKVVDGDGREHEVLTFGPVSVLPVCQRKGIGSALIERTIGMAREMGYRAIIISGHPAYYPRFGFKNAGAFGITTSEGKNLDAFMALELHEDSLQGLTGKFHEDSAFQVDEAELTAFEKRFPYKEKHITDTQWR